MHKTLSILVAEDDEMDILIYQRAFRRENFDGALRFVANGQEVIDYLIGIGKYSDRVLYPLPGLILLDIKMPKVGGFEALRWIRKDTRFKDIPVVIVSSSILPRDFDQAIALGANGYFAKTVAFVGLIETIQEKTGLLRRPTFSTKDSASALATVAV